MKPSNSDMGTVLPRDFIDVEETESGYKFGTGKEDQWIIIEEKIEAER